MELSKAARPPPAPLEEDRGGGGQEDESCKGGGGGGGGGGGAGAVWDPKDTVRMEHALWLMGEWGRRGMWAGN